MNYRKGTWHHSLLGVDRVADYLVVDRGGTGNNCEEVDISSSNVWLLDERVSMLPQIQDCKDVPEVCASFICAARVHKLCEVVFFCMFRHYAWLGWL